jgi:type VI secretion system secreted protein Hcp
MALADHYLKLDGIDGESQDSKHKGQIDILSFSFGANQTGTSSLGGGAGKGKVKMHDFTIVKKIDKSSPKLFEHCCSGEVIKTATLFVRKAGKDQQEYYNIKLTDVLVSSFLTGESQPEGAGGSGAPVAPGAEWEPSERVALNFSKIEIGYKEQKPDGTLGGEIKGGWDVKGNVKT